MAESDRIVFFGYSMPQADIEAEKMFQRQITSNVKVPWIGVVDPAVDATSRIYDMQPVPPSVSELPGAISAREQDFIDA